MKNCLWCAVVSISLFAAATAQLYADEITLYSSGGQPVAYIADDLTIYLWSGKPVAYLHSDDVYSFNGKHLGWFVRGLVYNHDGEVVGAIRSRLRSVPQISPIKSIKEIKPIKGIREISPVMPLFRLLWAEDETLGSFLLVGDESRSKGGAECESGHWIDSIVGDGKIITLEDGSMWTVDDVDTVTTSLWLPISNVEVCGRKMINVDDKESAGVTPLRITPHQSGARSNSGGYLIEAAVDDETFVINGETFEAKTYCFGFEKGDRVSFVEGSPLGACASAKLLNLRSDKVCEVWCK